MGAASVPASRRSNRGIPFVLQMVCLEMLPACSSLREEASSALRTSAAAAARRSSATDAGFPLGMAVQLHIVVAIPPALAAPARLGCALCQRDRMRLRRVVPGMLSQAITPHNIRNMTSEMIGGEPTQELLSARPLAQGSWSGILHHACTPRGSASECRAKQSCRR